MKSILVLAALLLCAAGALAQEPAFTNRATELKDRAAPEAKTVASLPENTPVQVLARQGGWTRVEASGQQGWVRVFHLRFPAAVQSSESSAGGALAGIGSALGFGQRERRANVATTGIRGLSPEDLKNADPDPEALRRLQSYRADRAAAERFARDGRLATVSIEPEGAAR